MGVETWHGLRGVCGMRGVAWRGVALRGVACVACVHDLSCFLVVHFRVWPGLRL